MALQGSQGLANLMISRFLRLRPKLWQRFSSEPPSDSGSDLAELLQAERDRSLQIEKNIGYTETKAVDRWINCLGTIFQILRAISQWTPMTETECDESKSPSPPKSIIWFGFWPRLFSRRLQLVSLFLRFDSLSQKPVITLLIRPLRHAWPDKSLALSHAENEYVPSNFRGCPQTITDTAPSTPNSGLLQSTPF